MNKTFAITFVMMLAFAAFAYQGAMILNAYADEVELQQQENKAVNLMGCYKLEFNDRYLGGTDSDCQAAGMLLLNIIDGHEYPCVFITNKTWYPGHPKRLIFRETAVKLAGGY